jgi:hypothetical protein
MVIIPPLFVPHIRRMAPSTPNMGSIGHGRNYVRSNKSLGTEDVADWVLSSALLAD